MERYIDGFVLPVKHDNLESYRDMASDAGKLWIKHGALEYFECTGDDVDPDMEGVKIQTFPELVDTAPDETVVFSFIVYESREHRDNVNAKVMDDPEMDPENFEGEMPFDMERMAMGGFRSIVAYED